MESTLRLPYDLLAGIFKIYVSLPDTLPETLMQVCRRWSRVASTESALWTKFVISRQLMISNDALTRDWVGVFRRRLVRAGPSRLLRVFILHLNELLLPVIDVVSGPDYVHLPRWETFTLRSFGALIRPGNPDLWGSIASLITQPFPSLKRITLQQVKIDFHAFANAPNVEEFTVLYCRSPRIGKRKGFRNLKTLHITYPSKYPLSLVPLRKFSLRTIETLTIGGYVDFGKEVKGRYPSLSTLVLTDRVPRGIVYMSAQSLRHLILGGANLFCLYELDRETAEIIQAMNKEVLGMLAEKFPTVEVLEIHEMLKDLVLEMTVNKALFAGLKELWSVSKHGRKRIRL